VTRLLWSPRASSDLDLIREYISRDSPVYADLVIQRLVLAPERLIQFPEIGRVVPEVMSSPNLREIIVRPYRVVYRIRPGLVEIVTVFRSSRQFPADLE
jgi:addiction module RelE/StbE family toxin